MYSNSLGACLVVAIASTAHGSLVRLDHGHQSPLLAVTATPTATSITNQIPAAPTAVDATSQCLRTSSGTFTRFLTARAPGLGQRLSPYGTKIEIDTFISPCTAAPFPRTTTQIQTVIASYIPEAGLEGGTTVHTLTWANFPASPTYATRNTGAGLSCGECPDKDSDWAPDQRCEAKGYTTGCNMQCGFFKSQYTCLQNSTREGEFFEGRVCWDPTGKDMKMVHLGEPCHVGDSMVFCTPCKRYENPNLNPGEP